MSISITNSKFINNHYHPQKLHWFKPSSNIPLLSKSDIQNKYLYTKEIARVSLGLTNHQLKHYYTIYNIGKWPYRRLQSIKVRKQYFISRLDKLHRINPNNRNNNELLLRVRNTIERLNNLENEIINNPTSNNYRNLINTIVID